MSEIVCFIFWILLILGIFAIYLHNDLLNPLTGYLLPISIGFILYYYLYRIEHQVTERTLLCFSFGAICFLIGYFVFGYFFKQKIPINKKERNKNNEILLLYKIIIFLGIIVNCIEFYKNGISGPFGNNFLRNVRWNSLYSGRKNFLGTYSTVFLHVTTCILLQYGKTEKRWKQKFFVLLLLFSTIFSMARSTMLQYIISIVYICYFSKEKRGIQKKYFNIKQLLSGNIKIICLFLVVFFAFSAVALVTNKLGGESILDKEFYLYKYLGYPIVAFDINVMAFPRISKGYYSLGPIGKVLGIFGVYHVSEFSSLGVAGPTQFLVVFFAFSAVALVTNKLGGESILDKEFYLYKYLGYPIVAFDINVMAFPRISKGYYSLGPIGKVLGIFGVYHVSEFSSLGVAGPTQFNVYSYLAAPYKDFGIIGIIVISLFLGFISGMFYWFSIRKKGEWTVFYSVYIYGILMAFYSYQFAMTYYFYIAAILILYRCVKIKKNRIVLLQSIK